MSGNFCYGTEDIPVAAFTRSQETRRAVTSMFLNTVVDRFLGTTVGFFIEVPAADSLRKR